MNAIPYPRTVLCTFTATLGLVLSVAGSMGQSTVWDGGGDGVTWSDAANWSAGVPNPTTQARFLNGTFPDAPISITVDGTQTANAFNFGNFDNRTYTFNGGQFNLVADGTIAWNTSFSADAAIIVNSNIDYSSATPATDTTFQIGVLQPITFNGNITTSGTGGRTMQIFGSSAAQVVTINGSNAANFFSYGGVGEVIAGSTTALGLGGVQKTTSSILSLRSDVTVDGTWNQSANRIVSFRINELAPSSADRTLTINDRIIGNSGGIEWVDNINSTGKLILELKYNGGNAQAMPLVTNASGIVRFAQAPSATRTYSGLISGAGSVELTAGGSMALSAANTYTGTTTVSNGTLLISGGGTIQGTSELNVGTGATFNLSGITPTSYTFGSSQTLSGTGTIVAGGKDVVLDGTLAPGNSPGTLTFDMGAGTLALGSSSTFVFELGTASDLVLLSSGTLDIGAGTLDFSDFSFLDAGGFVNGSYTLFQTSTAILGSLGTATGSIGSRSGELAISGNDLVLNVIPEPGTAALFVLAGFYFVGRLRKLRNA